MAKSDSDHQRVYTKSIKYVSLSPRTPFLSYWLGLNLNTQVDQFITTVIEMQNPKILTGSCCSLCLILADSLLNIKVSLAKYFLSSLSQEKCIFLYLLKRD